MKGIQLIINEKQKFLGAIEEGITSVLITLKKEKYELLFSSLNLKDNIWYKTDLKVGDLLEVSLNENIDNVCEAQEIRDYNIPKEEMDKRELEIYYELRQDLIEEGLLSEDE